MCSKLQIEPRALFWCVCYDGNNLALEVNYQGSCVVFSFDCNRTVGNHPQCGQRVQTFRVLLHGANRTRTGHVKEDSCPCTRSAEISRSSKSRLWGSPLRTWREKEVGGSQAKIKQSWMRNSCTMSEILVLEMPGKTRTENICFIYQQRSYGQPFWGHILAEV